MGWKRPSQIKVFREQLEDLLGLPIDASVGKPSVVLQSLPVGSLCMNMLTGDLFQFHGERWEKLEVNTLALKEYLPYDDPLYHALEGEHFRNGGFSSKTEGLFSLSSGRVGVSLNDFLGEDDE